MKTIDFELLTKIQHYDGKTNLIDFTTDCLIALFFACDGDHDKDGRVILQKTEKIRNMIDYPRNPRHRVIAQKSVFIRPPMGFIQPLKDEIVIIPTHLKKLMLEHLRTYHGISTETIYNDLHGFIRNQDIHGGAYTRFYKGLACQNRGDQAATVKEKQKEYEESIQYYNEAIKLKPDFVVAYYNRGIAHNNKGEYDNALWDFNMAIYLNPNYADAYINRGFAYHCKGEYDNAIRDFNMAIHLNPNSVLAYTNRGMTYNNKGEYDNALWDFNMAIHLNPNYALAYNSRGFSYNRKGEYNRAIVDYNRAIGLNPRFTLAYYNRGIAWLHLSEWANAKSDLMTAKNMQSDIINVFYNSYGGVAIFEQQYGIQLPPDITAMLTPQ